MTFCFWTIFLCWRLTPDRLSAKQDPVPGTDPTTAHYFQRTYAKLFEL